MITLRTPIYNMIWRGILLLRHGRVRYALLFPSVYWFSVCVYIYIYIYIMCADGKLFFNFEHRALIRFAAEGHCFRFPFTCFMPLLMRAIAPSWWSRDSRPFFTFLLVPCGMDLLRLWCSGFMLRRALFTWAARSMQSFPLIGQPSWILNLEVSQS